MSSLLAVLEKVLDKKGNETIIIMREEVIDAEEKNTAKVLKTFFF